MQYIIERERGMAGFEKTLETIEVDDGRYSSAIDALRDVITTPFNPVHRGQEVKFEAARPTLAFASLPTAGGNYSDGWTCTAICPEEGFGE